MYLEHCPSIIPALLGDLQNLFFCDFAPVVLVAQSEYPTVIRGRNPPDLVRSMWINPMCKQVLTPEL